MNHLQTLKSLEKKISLLQDYITAATETVLKVPIKLHKPHTMAVRQHPYQRRPISPSYPPSLAEQELKTFPVEDPYVCDTLKLQKIEVCIHYHITIVCYLFLFIIFNVDSFSHLLLIPNLIYYYIILYYIILLYYN